MFDQNTRLKTLTLHFDNASKDRAATDMVKAATPDPQAMNGPDKVQGDVAGQLPKGINPSGTPITPDPSLQAQAETTKLSPLEETLFNHWKTASGITDDGEPDTFYDYRGLYKATNGQVVPGQQGLRHFPDTFKQHGHPTFSQESQYSKGPSDGGMWVGPNQDKFLPQGAMMPSHLPQMDPIPSHGGELTMPGQPSLAQILLQKQAIQNNLQNVNPIQEFLNYHLRGGR